MPASPCRAGIGYKFLVGDVNRKATVNQYFIPANLSLASDNSGRPGSASLSKSKDDQLIA